MTAILRFTALLVLLALLGCATDSGLSHSSPDVVTTASSLPAPDVSSTSSDYQRAAEYRIGPEDLLEVIVYGQPELTRTVRVNFDGRVSLPLSGDFMAGGKTVEELQKLIAGKLQENFLQNPQVSVFIKEYTSQRVTVEGAVRKPGVYPLSGKSTLLQTIALAEGLDPLANTRGVVIFRTIEGRKMGAVYDIKAIRNGQVEDPQVFGNDMVVVDQSGSKTALRRFIESMPALGVFGLF